MNTVLMDSYKNPSTTAEWRESRKSGNKNLELSKTLLNV
jgi:hypothetical protein